MRDEAPTERGPGEVVRRIRFYYALVALLAVMFGAEVVMHYTLGPVTRWLVTATAVAATLLALGSGLTWRDLGLSRDTFARGLRYSAVIVGVVLVVIAVGLAIPPLRDLFRNNAYRDLPGALFSAFVLIPLLTVLPEELLFRGVLTGALLRRHSVRTTVVVQALFFGLWHVVSSTGLSAGNEGIGDVVGRGPIGVLLGVLGAVAFTTIAGLIFGWLRMRTGSLLPSIALHWAANGAGAIAAALAWQIG